MTTRTRKPAGRIAFVGLGPGDPGLLTRRAHDALADADQVIYDRGVPEPLLDVLRAEAKPDAQFSPAEGVPGDVAKVLLSAALLHNPRILVLDEPVSGLDVATGLVLRTVVRSLADANRIVFYSSHELETVEKISSRVMILRGGRVVADDSAARLRELMSLPSLEQVFAELAVSENVDSVAQGLVEAAEL